MLDTVFRSVCKFAALQRPTQVILTESMDQWKHVDISIVDLLDSIVSQHHCWPRVIMLEGVVLSPNCKAVRMK